MRVALVTPQWSFDHSIYFGCREPHLPLEYGAAKTLLEAAGHKAEIIDGHIFGLSHSELAAAVRAFQPDMTVVTTAPSYLFWRCAPPELRVPQDVLHELDGVGGAKIVIGPHASTTPRATLKKLPADVAVMGECEELLVALADGAGPGLRGTAWRNNGEIEVHGGPVATRFTDLPAIEWEAEWINRHYHHHHRFEAEPAGPGAEVEASRGCPYHCTFCAKIDFRDSYRRRELPLLLEEIDALIAQGVGYVYFIDEIFLPQRPLLEALVERDVVFGVQTRIDLWKPDLLALLGRAGCVSIEAGVESLTAEGRDSLNKRCRLDTEQLADLLITARRHVPFVQANLIGMEQDEPALVETWRTRLIAAGVWANEPVPLYPYPSSPSYRALWGEPDDQAWERAHEHYLKAFTRFSDIQEERPKPLRELEDACCARV